MKFIILDLDLGGMLRSPAGLHGYRLPNDGLGPTRSVGAVFSKSGCRKNRRNRPTALLGTLTLP